MTKCTIVSGRYNCWFADGQPGLSKAALSRKSFSSSGQPRILSDTVLNENSYAEQSVESSSGYSSASLVQAEIVFCLPLAELGVWVDSKFKMSQQRALAAEGIYDSMQLPCRKAGLLT